jgi:hypothetical protein
MSEIVRTGSEAELMLRTAGGTFVTKGFFLRLPAIFARLEFCCETKDNRVIRHYINPGVENTSAVPVKERGVYFSGFKTGSYDKLIFFDAPGFFRLALPLHQSERPRLFAIPCPAEDSIHVSLKSGGAAERTEPYFRKSDELIDHRPYVPGDDPRRINWKLYSHAPMGDLFVREEEPEPPPHSRLLVLIDTEYDSSLYNIEEARHAIDLLCENALALIQEFSGLGMDICIGCTGSRIIKANPAEFAAALAWPAAVLIGRDLPTAHQDRSVLIFALPRMNSISSGLDRFLKNRAMVTEGGVSGGTVLQRGADIVFLYDGKSRRASELEEAAASCVRYYNGKPNLRAVKVQTEKAQEEQDREPDR